MSSFGGRTRLDGIEQMRGLAALGVVVAHVVDSVTKLGARVDGLFLPSVPAANDFGACGVDLFFVISGFVMTYAISQGPPISATRFAWNRFKRIVPAFWLASIGYALLLLSYGEPIDPRTFLTTVSIVPLADQGEYVFPTLYVGWTLAFELCFYLLVAIVVATGRRSVGLGILSLVAATALLGIMWRPSAITVRFLINPIYLEFACGIVGYLLFVRGFHGVRARCALICLVACFLAAITMLPIDLGVSLHPVAIIGGDASLKRALMFGPAFTLLLLGSIEPARRAGRIGRFLLIIGRASYSVYLTHAFVMSGAEHAWLGAWRPNVYWVVAVLVMSSTTLGVVVHRYVERPLLDLLGRSRSVDRREIAMASRSGDRSQVAARSSVTLGDQSLPPHRCSI
jgi:peptidoglycan/LPS O-acetylase OafA/YrhL